MSQSTTELVIALSDIAERQRAVQLLARRVGADALLILVRDPEVEAWIPAPGLPQTVRAGPSWRQFLHGCPERGSHTAEVELPPGQWRRAQGHSAEGALLVLLGGREPAAPELQSLITLLPLLAALLRSELRVGLARAAAAAAEDASRRGHELARALESARADAFRLNAELRREQQRKDSFLAMLGHELRNPLAPLVTSLELLRLKQFAPAEQQHQFTIMDRQLAHLARLVEDLLDMSRISLGQIDIRRQLLDLNEVLRDALEEVRPLLEGQGHRLELQAPDQPVLVEGDFVRLVQVFGNLLNNAAKYMDPGGHILLRLEHHAGRAIVSVSDAGIGIDAEMLSQVFDPFVQGPGMLERGEGGLGIGLTLVKTLVELHDGEVYAESPGVGQGSTFRVLLAAADSAAAGADEPVGALDDVQAAAPPRAFRTVVVDDNRDAADTLATLLRVFGNHTEVAYDGDSALDLAQRLQPDLMLVDIGLPDIDGYEVARRLRDAGLSSTRLVALTGFGTPEARRRAEQAGFDALVVKPLSMPGLKDILRDAEESGGR